MADQEVQQEETFAVGDLVKIIGKSGHQEDDKAYGARASNYEGHTGKVTVLHGEEHRVGVENLPVGKRLFHEWFGWTHVKKLKKWQKKKVQRSSK